jgi:hypothetical protein
MRDEADRCGESDPRPLKGDTYPLTPAEAETESLLTRLRPVADVGRDDMLRLMFRAGQAAGAADGRRAARRQLVFWRAAAAMLLAGTGFAFAVRPGAAVVERDRVVYVDRPAAPAAPAANPTPPPQVERLTSPPGPAPREPMSLAYHRPLVPAADADYLTLRDSVLRWGERVMPAPPPRGGAVAAARAPTLEGLLGGPPAARPPRFDLRDLTKSLIPLGDRL